MDKFEFQSLTARKQYEYACRLARLQPSWFDYTLSSGLGCDLRIVYGAFMAVQYQKPEFVEGLHRQVRFFLKDSGLNYAKMLIANDWIVYQRPDDYNLTVFHAEPDGNNLNVLWKDF